MTTEQLWQRYRIINLQRANSSNPSELDGKLATIIKEFEDSVGYNPANLASSVRKKPIESGDIVWCTHHNEWVHVIDDEEGPAKQMLCLFQTGQTQSIPVIYLKPNN